MVNVGILLGKSQHKDSAEDVAEWKGLLTREELQLRQSLKRQGKDAVPPAIGSNHSAVYAAGSF